MNSEVFLEKQFLKTFLMLKGILEMFPAVSCDVHDVLVHIPFILYLIFQVEQTVFTVTVIPQYSDVTMTYYKRVI